MKRTPITESYRCGTRALAEGESRIDREKNLIKGVKLLGLESKNDQGRRKYRVPEASLYEGVPVKIDHYSESALMLLGSVVPGTVTSGDDGVFGDVQYNPKKSVTEEILWWVENNPSVLGMSHVAYGFSEEIDGTIWITVEEVESVDLVDRPATTKGMFESHKQENDMDWEKLYKESQAALVKSEASVADLGAKLGVAEQGLVAEKAAHEATKREVSRAELLRASGLKDVAESFAKAITNAATDEDAQALIEAVKAQVKPESTKPTGVVSVSSEAASGKNEGPQTYKTLKESGVLDYKKVL